MKAQAPPPGRVSAYNSERTRIENADLCILRSPVRVSINDRPSSPGQIPFTGAFNGIRLEIADRTRGLLSLQCVLRTFGELPSETILETSVDIEEADSVVKIPLKAPAEAAPHLLKTAEPWLVWKGTSELSLVSQPTIY